ncbi:MAG: glycosyltransferase, partial [Cytophagaceae bacterium]
FPPMKILVALSRFPFPIDKGDKLRAYYQIRHLSRNHEVYLVCLTEKDPSAEEQQHIRQFCKELVLVRHSPLKRFANLSFSFFNSRPFQVNYFSSDEMKEKIRGLILREKIDLCYVQLVRLVENIPFGMQTSYYLDYMDALSEGMNKRYTFSSFYEKPLVAAEASRLRTYEKEVFERFDGCSIISSSDAGFFSEAQKSTLDIIPNGVSQDFFAISSASEKYELIFTGNMNYHPNIQACKFLVLQILPRLKKHCPDIKICLAGTDPHPEVSALAGANVLVTGYVKDIREYLAVSRLFVAPLFSGSGLQNKLLEAMASGLPVVTTPLAGQALNAEPWKHLLLCDSASEFADTLLRLLQNEREAELLGNAGRDFVKEHFDWDVNNAKLEEALLKSKKHP